MPVKTMDEALEPFDVEGQLFEIAMKQWGATHAQATDFSKLHRDEFGLVDGVATHIATGLPADHKDTFALIAKAYPHLVPPPFEVSLSDRAFLQNDMTARGQLVREIGAGPAQQLAERYGHRDLMSRAQGKRPDNLDAPAEDNKPKIAHANNPWHRSAWNVSKQGSVLRALGAEKAAALARSVGCVIGSVRPNPNY